MPVPRKLLAVLLLLAACTPAVHAPVPAEEPLPVPAPAPEPAAAPGPPPPSPVEQARQAEERLEVVELPPLPAAASSVVEVSFDAGAAELSAAARGVLDRMSAALPGDGAPYFLEIQGHADPSGSAASNRRLAEQRADAVRRYLHHEHGVPLAAMGVVPLGTSVPAADNDTAEGRARNRRAVVVFLPPL